MLHAVNRRKARLDAFKAAGQRVPLEDVVTSTVFGPLLFIDQAEAEKAMSLIFAAIGMQPPPWVGPAHLSLWPKRATMPTLRSSYVEPDAEITDAEGTSLLIEVKWGADLGPKELAAQWLSLPPNARSRSRHLLLVLETDRYAAAIQADRRTIASECEIAWPIHLVTWRRLADGFRTVGGDVSLNPGTRRWALGVHGFLRREDPLSLVGWSDLGLELVPEADWQYFRKWFAPASSASANTWNWHENWFQRLEARMDEADWRFAR